jgi:heme A synthase
MIREVITPNVLEDVTKIRKVFHRVSTLLGYTILSGAFVAGIDAGMAYNTFPKMNDQWIPDGIFDMDVRLDVFSRNVNLIPLKLVVHSLGGETFLRTLLLYNLIIECWL